jgi:hypothetical protein
MQLPEAVESADQKVLRAKEAPQEVAAEQVVAQLEAADRAPVVRQAVAVVHPAQAAGSAKWE